ncbi:DUF1540 domain-containing protein [Clostridium chauvoei]|uniref:DUF1540 domain-containing protein n=2 Tax=Clostridium chauvoei TaxID=46867 RepID=S6EMA2_9CLOT|nr:DUF1540 domain-containing protein [Clostridium chauvoei]ATD55632.1 DUF1540 domain-containing protein [Clostridium chauvoei]ATD56691.1 DUF1540 domain-containing protein [Clostridium chauvoei]MBX7280131.1 DUF1540 domain-containing protein [Clostridium chauvoei]MBX7282615.1 DUF1540 domain-containing protein [Clostridium chauvoei]MBX7285022.1 DUF1540 domain-containing protein [Clostridium chauvoei]
MQKNPSIKCTINQCKHHACSENYCTLNVIEVGTHEANPKMPECTDCNSFVLK